MTRDGKRGKMRDAGHLGAKPWQWSVKGEGIVMGGEVKYYRETEATGGPGRDVCFRVTGVDQVNKLAQQYPEYEITARYSSKKGRKET